VHDAAVVPTPGRHGYEDIHAFIAADRTVDQASVTMFCAIHLATGKRPQIIDFIDAIPRNASGKVETWRLPSVARRAGG
jgi:fatty-acyl-CoA synthase